MKTSTSKLAIVVAILIAILSLFFFIYKHEQKKEVKEIISEERISAKEIESQYDKLKIGNTVTDISNVLGKPIYTESYTSDSSNGSTLYTWGSNNTNEIGARLTVTTQNDKVLNKSVSGLYVPYDKDKLVSSEKFKQIKLNNGFTFEQSVREFGNPNDISEYKNSNGKIIKTVTWSTNTTGTVGSYFTIIFSDGIAIEKNEIGLIW